MNEKLKIVFSVLIAIAIWSVLFKFIAVLGLSAIIVIIVGTPLALVSYIVYRLIS